MKFKAGQLVKYVGDCSPWLFGRIGKVLEQTDYTNVGVDFSFVRSDGTISHKMGVLPENIVVVEQQMLLQFGAEHIE